MLRAISILSVFCRDTSALRSSSYSYLINKTINYPSHLQQDVLSLSEVNHARRLVWETFTTVAGSFAIWPIAEQWFGSESSFLPSLCVSSLTHNHFSLPISLQSQLLFKSPLHPFPITSITIGVYLSCTVSSLQTELLMPSPSFITFSNCSSLLCMHVTKSGNGWDWKGPLVSETLIRLINHLLEGQHRNPLQFGWMDLYYSF